MALIRRGVIPRKNFPARRVTETLDKFNRPSGLTYTNFVCKNCTIQPFVGDVMVLGSDGMSESASFVMYTDTPMYEGGDGVNKKADQVMYLGSWHKVVKVKPWLSEVIPHYEVYLVKLDGDLI
jgi:hypothetical protein